MSSDGERQSLLRDRFTMDQEDLFQALRGGLQPGEQFALIGVTAQFVQLHHFRAQSHRISEDRNFTLLLDDLPAERVFGLIPRDQNGVSRVLDVVFQMMQDPSGFTHS